ncbi:MAG: class I SAM-dependent methyltransferase [Bryobacteraceae bacterium]
MSPGKVETLGVPVRANSRALWLCAGLVSLGWLGLMWFLTTTHWVSLNSAISSIYIFFSRPEVDQVPVENLKPLGAPYAAALTKLYQKEPQKGTDGVMHKPMLGVGIKISEGMFMYDLARRVKARNTMEVGLASGYSPFFFLAATHANGGGTHVAMDPFQNTDFYGVGLQAVRDAGLEHDFRFMEQYSQLAIPELVKEGKKFEVIFIDGDHRFDGTIIDFSLADLACAPGCYIVLHDRWMPSVQRVVSWIRKNRPDYQPEFSSQVPNLGVFRKVGEDKRQWTHYVPF